MTTSTKSKVACSNSGDASVFYIHQKLKTYKPSLSYTFLAQPHQSNVQYDLRVNYIDNEFSLYEKNGDYFFLIDFFSNINEACPEALKIIEEWPQAKKSILALLEIEYKK